jgi:peroxiredoxin Q/BCP
VDGAAPAGRSGLPSVIDTDLEPVGRRPAAGDPAPDFSLAGTGSRTYSLADARGGPLVLVFYPADNSPVCTQQLRSYSEDLSLFEGAGATVWCLSPQDVDTHERFAAEQSLELPLLADLGAEVGRDYDILGPLGFYRRSVFVIDGEGTIRWARRSLSSLTYLPAERLIEAIASTAG